jgi:hypothetical protein
LKTVAIITCAGSSGRWQKYLGVEKQLVPVSAAGESMLARTVRLLRQKGVENIHVVTGKPQVKTAPLDAAFITPASNRWLTNTILSTRHVWADRNIILPGDVYFSSDAITRILSDRADIRFYGIDRARARLLKRRAEIFAFAFRGTEVESVTRMLVLNSVLAAIRDASPHMRFWMPARIRHLMQLNPVAEGIDESRLSLVKRLVRIYSPAPPTILRRMGVGPSRVWRALRFLFFRPPHQRPHGKLWGLYMELAQLDLYGGEGCSWPSDENPLFTELNDVTQDCDVPADYDRLMSSLRLDDQANSLDRPCQAYEA